MFVNLNRKSTLRLIDGAVLCAVVVRIVRRKRNITFLVTAAVFLTVCLDFTDFSRALVLFLPKVVLN